MKFYSTGFPLNEKRTILWFDTAHEMAQANAAHGEVVRPFREIDKTGKELFCLALDKP